MVRDFAHAHPLIFLSLVCVAFGFYTAERFFYREELHGAPWKELVVGGIFFSAILFAIVFPITWLALAPA